MLHSILENVPLRNFMTILPMRLDGPVGHRVAAGKAASRRGEAPEVEWRRRGDVERAVWRKPDYLQNKF